MHTVEFSAGCCCKQFISWHTSIFLNAQPYTSQFTYTCHICIYSLDTFSFSYIPFTHSSDLQIEAVYSYILNSCGSTGARTRGILLTVQTLYHWPTEPCGRLTNNLFHLIPFPVTKWSHPQVYGTVPGG